MELLARGRDADVFVLDEARVLRRYRDGRSARHEADLIGRLADAGFPTPRAVAYEGPDLVLERVAGPDLMTAVGAGLLSLDDAGVALADLHRRLHALPWDGGTLLHLDLHPSTCTGARAAPCCSTGRTPASARPASTWP
ncbi:phosphotransferase [Xylanimonas protaetiae]|uniref:Uncharacterized protein n=1 Tax=Xylanimonas protaetiae TaxID=2509457 RepID=A0A4P6FCT4_9MICO|nr:phosphotransferase [Xylanimonas protaetiae]QAY71367.1 hypothetical protein ET471_16115 [Xylanimonas protaetiae]